MCLMRSRKKKGVISWLTLVFSFCCHYYFRAVRGIKAVYSFFGRRRAVTSDQIHFQPKKTHEPKVTQTHVSLLSRAPFKPILLAASPLTT